jgi:hypothetical protein
VFSLVNAIVLRTLPVPDSQQLYQARSHSPGREFGDIFSAPGFEHDRTAPSPGLCIREHDGGPQGVHRGSGLVHGARRPRPLK